MVTQTLRITPIDVFISFLKEQWKWHARQVGGVVACGDVPQIFDVGSVAWAMIKPLRVELRKKPFNLAAVPGILTWPPVEIASQMSTERREIHIICVFPTIGRYALWYTPIPSTTYSHQDRRSSS